MVNLIHEEIIILKYLDQNVYVSRPEAFRLFSITSDFLIDHLLELGYIKILKAPSSNEFDWFLLTPKGQAYINEYKYNQQKEDAEISRICHDARFSKITAIIAIIISIFAVIVPVLFG